MKNNNGGGGNGEGDSTEGSSYNNSNALSGEEEKMSKLTISTLQAREEEIERRKIKVTEKVQLQIARAQDEARRLAHIWDELEAMEDPTRKEIANVRKRIDTVKRELKSLGQICQKKEKEYKEVVEIFDQKSHEKGQLVATLVKLLGQSERWRMTKLEELSKHIEWNH